MSIAKHGIAKATFLRIPSYSYLEWPHIRYPVTDDLVDGSAAAFRKLRRKKKIYIKERLKNDLVFKIRRDISSNMYNLLKNIN